MRGGETSGFNSNEKERMQGCVRDTAREGHAQPWNKLPRSRKQ